MTINHTHNILSAALRAAENIHICICWNDMENAMQAKLNAALHSVLTVAEECRQELLDRPEREAAIRKEVRARYVSDSSEEEME